MMKKMPWPCPHSLLSWESCYCYYYCWGCCCGLLLFFSWAFFLSWTRSLHSALQLLLCFESLITIIYICMTGAFVLQVEFKINSIFSFLIDKYDILLLLVHTCSFFFIFILCRGSSFMNFVEHMPISIKLSMQNICKAQINVQGWYIAGYNLQIW